MATKKQATENIKKSVYLDGSWSIYSKFWDQIQILYSIMKLNDQFNYMIQ